MSSNQPSSPAFNCRREFPVDTVSLMRVSLFLVMLVALASSSHAALLYTGTNLAGADFGEGTLPGTYNTHYTYPTAEEVDYYIGKGMNTFRIPFRWERLQQSQNSSLDVDELNRLEGIVNYATSQGAHVVLDPHNYARYYGDVIGGGSVPNSSFNDFWTKVANVFKNNSKVIFGLMNEPNTMTTEQWGSAAQDAIDAIRETGANNLVLVPGNAWTGAHSWLQNWYGTPNADVMINIMDSANNFAFDLHQYLDSDSSGTTSNVVSETIGQERLVAVTNWLRTNNRKAFLGEFAVANSTIGGGPSNIGDEAMTNMLQYIEDNDDVWLGWTWWAGGPWWGNYRFTIEPTNLGEFSETDRPVLGVIEPFFVEAVESADFDGNNFVDGADFLIWQEGFGLTGQVDNSNGDANNDGLVDSGDLPIFEAQYGTPPPGLAAAAAQVPEPTTCGLAFAATLFLAIGGRRFRQ